MLSSYNTSVAPAFRTGRSRAGAVLDLLLLWLERATQWRQLRALNGHALKDIGISRADADHETDKPFWRA